MKRHIGFLTAALLPTATHVEAQAADRELLRMDSTWARNYATHDTATAMNLMAADFFMTATNGSTKNRTAEMGDIRPTAGLRMHYFRTTQVRWAGSSSRCTLDVQNDPRLAQSA